MVSGSPLDAIYIATKPVEYLLSTIFCVKFRTCLNDDSFHGFDYFQRRDLMTVVASSTRRKIHWRSRGTQPSQQLVIYWSATGWRGPLRWTESRWTVCLLDWTTPSQCGLSAGEDLSVTTSRASAAQVSSSSSSSSFIRSVNIKQSCTAMQYSGAGQQGPRKDTDSCPKQKHDMTAMHFTINQHYK